VNSDYIYCTWVYIVTR